MGDKIPFMTGEWTVTKTGIMVNEELSMCNPVVFKKFKKEGIFEAVEVSNPKYSHRHLVPQKYEK